MKTQNYFKLNWEKDYLLVLGVMTLAYAFCMPDRGQWWSDYVKLLKHQTYLVHDSIEVAGLAAAFINVALHFFLAYWLHLRNNLTRLTGLQLAATGMFIGHAFFGTHLLNVLPIIAGVVLYAKWEGYSFKRYTSLSLFATCTAPVVSFIALYQGLSLLSLVLAVLAGLFLGFISAPLAEEFLKFHHGYTLYNFGFTGGIIALFVYVCLNYFGIDLPRASLVSQNAHGYLLIYLLFLCLIVLLVSFYQMESRQETKMRLIKLNRRVGRLPDDFILKYGQSVTFLNMGLVGLVFLAILLSLRITINGPVAGGLIAVMSFAAFGKHLRNTLPVAAGVVLATFFSGQAFDSLGFTLPLLFGTSLAPIAGYYGVIAGVLAGFLQYNVTQSVIDLHLGLSLYNNGFSSGFVAAFLLPIMDTVRSRWQGRKGN